MEEFAVLQLSAFSLEVNTFSISAALYLDYEEVSLGHKDPKEGVLFSFHLLPFESMKSTRWQANSR